MQNESSKREGDFLTLFFPVAEGIGKVLGSNCEVVVHSLKDLSSSVIKIVNGHITGRKEGAPMTDMGIEIMEKLNSQELNVVGPYITKTRNGKILQSITTIIRDFDRTVIGLLCINVDLSVPFIDFIENFSPNSKSKDTPPPEHFPLSAPELILETYKQVVLKLKDNEFSSRSDRNKMIVNELYLKNIFDIKGAIDLITNELEVSRFTIYNYIREAKSKLKISRSF